eukprot:10835566-Lingulodinium_polyedra.AAC.1
MRAARVYAPSVPSRVQSCVAVAVSRRAARRSSQFAIQPSRSCFFCAGRAIGSRAISDRARGRGWR